MFPARIAPLRCVDDGQSKVENSQANMQSSKLLNTSIDYLHSHIPPSGNDLPLNRVIHLTNANS